MPQENWQRWGADDELGTLNLITRDKAVEAASLVVTGEIFALGQPLSPGTPVSGHRAGISHFMGRDGGDYAAGAQRPDGFQFAEDTLILPLHSGTHIDALCHVWYEDKLYNGFPGDSIRSTVGAQHCGADKLQPIFSRGVLLDVEGVCGRLANGTTIGRSMIEAAVHEAGTEIRSGDAVLIRTGWLENYGAGKVDFGTEIGIDVEAGLWLAEAGASLIGADNFAIEVLPFPAATVFPVHKRLIRDYGLALLEGLVLDGLARAGAKTFLFVATPLSIIGATASPVNPVAVL